MMLFTKVFKKSARFSAVALCLLLTSYVIAGCELTENHMNIDRDNNLSRQDYRDGLAPREAELEEFAAFDESIPPLQSYVSPVSENLKPVPLVSVSVNQTIPLRDVLFELADQAGYDLELDPRISGSIIFSAKNRPFDLVIDRISKIAGLRYSFDDDIMRVELDTPYTKNYKIDYLTAVRTSSSTVSNNISVVSGEGADTGSGFSIASESEADFWGELEANMEQILTSNASRGTLRTAQDPQIQIVPRNTGERVNFSSDRGDPTVAGEEITGDIEAVALDTDDDGDTDAVVQNEAGAASAPSPSTGGASLDENGVPLPTPGQDITAPPVIQPTNTVLQVSSSAAESGEDSNSVSYTPSFSINRQAGIVSVYGNERIHKEVTLYLAELRKSLASQVVIEAKVLEVGLTDEFATGINWSKVGDFISPELQLGFFDTDGNIRPPLSPTGGSSFILGYNGDDISAVVDALSRFGTVKALASPRLTVLNNQPATLSVAENRVYFRLDVDLEEGTEDDPGDRITVDSEINSVPEGVLVNVLPTINPDTGSIMMQVRPTVTRVINQIADPAVAFIAAQQDIAISSQIPELNVQEIDSVLSMQSGEVAVLGGLIQDRVDSQQESVPVLGELPLVGAAFRNQGDSVQKTELVIFIKATIVDAPDSVHQTDKELYRTFSQDRRPLKF